MFLICFLCYLSGLAENIKFSNSPLFFPTKIEERIRLFERDLSYSKQRLNIFQDTIGTVLKPRRAAIDLGGSALKRLFGVATQDDLESINRRIAGLTNQETAIFHILDKQATMINESLWEIRATTKMMAEL